MSMASGNASKEDATFRAPQRQRGRERVAALLSAASAVFAEKGFDAATMTEIAVRADAAIGTLYLFFPTKIVLAQTLAQELARVLSVALEKLSAEMAGRPAPEIADALFDTLFRFAAAHPAYGALIDLRAGDDWKQELRAKRRDQIAGLFAQASPTLPAGQPDRLAMIVPQLMRIALTVRGTRPYRDSLREELRLMLQHHLAWQDKPKKTRPRHS